MDDKRIIELLWQRDEGGLDAARQKYGRLCYSVAYNILGDSLDSEEAVNDTYLHAWNAIPPHRPTRLGAFLCKITRELSIDRYRRRQADKRSGSSYAASLEELKECLSAGDTAEEAVDAEALAAIIGAWLHTLSPAVRAAFVRRYFFADSLEVIARRQGVTRSWVKTALHRARQGLRACLEKEGYTV